MSRDVQLFRANWRRGGVGVSLAAAFSDPRPDSRAVRDAEIVQTMFDVHVDRAERDPEPEPSCRRVPRTHRVRYAERRSGPQIVVDETALRHARRSAREWQRVKRARSHRLSKRGG